MELYELLEKLAAKKGEKVKPGSLKGGPSEPASPAPAGEGSRFQALTEELKKKSSVTSEGIKAAFDRLYAKLAKAIKDPEALAAAIGRAKFGKKKFQEMAAAGRRRASKK